MRSPPKPARGRKTLALVVLAALALALVGGWVLRQRHHQARAKSYAAATSTGDQSSWPESGASLRRLAVRFPPSYGHFRVYLDAGHGAPHNTGNLSAFCVDEQDFTLSLARGLGQFLEQSAHFDVRLSRRDGQRTRYADRVAEADRWHAHVFLSLHSDVRGKLGTWSPDAGLNCPLNTDTPGFSVLWSDEGPESLAHRRLQLARATAAQLQRAGFLPYDGAKYRDNYAPDPSQAGVFVDRHAAHQRIFVLYRPSMASILIETHNATDRREAARWRQPETREAFSAAVTNALIALLP